MQILGKQPMDMQTPMTMPNSTSLHRRAPSRRPVSSATGLIGISALPTSVGVAGVRLDIRILSLILGLLLLLLLAA